MVWPAASRKLESRTQTGTEGPDTPQPIHFFEGWEEIPDTQDYPNGFRVEWELFLRHLVGEVPLAEQDPWIEPVID
ncbi:MAG: hypothetical protein JO279_13500 [Verrucomicrobia bacterium]|nr:hypothetical protein [Verrucomicrobiota bacterium]